MLSAEMVQALYDEHAAELTRFLTGVLGDPQLASDAVQMTFVKALEQGDAAKEESRKAWLFRVAYNEALALRRREATGERAIRRAGIVAWIESETPLVRQERGIL